jgi:putative spermidine/putrescine transport system permease protein
MIAKNRDANRQPPALYVVGGIVILFLILPIFIVIPISFSSSSYLQFPPKGFSLQWYKKFFNSYTWTTALFTSIKVAVATTILATLLGTLASFSFVRGRFKGKELLYPFILSPMVIPIIIFAIAVYFFFSKLHLIGKPAGLILAHTVLAVPFVIINVSATLKGFDINLEKAAMNLGARPLQTFLRITFPLIKPGVITGALFAFITSFDEIVVAMFISGTTAVTLPKRMLEGIRSEINPTISAVSTIEIAAVLIILLTTGLIGKKKPAFSRDPGT